MDNSLYEVQKAKKQLEDAHKQLEQERKELDKQKEEFRQMTKKLDFHVGNKIVLDIGGTRFSTSLENLQKIKDSFFSVMFSGTWKLKPESDGSYFIDRDGTNFRYILNYFRTGELTIDEDDSLLVRELLKEAEFYQIIPLVEELKNIISPLFQLDTVLLTAEYVNTINTWIGGKFTLNLLYRGSRDGFAAQIFHSTCDYKKKTITIIKDSNNNIFGGFTSKSWNNNGQMHLSKNDNTAFIFTLKNSHNIPPTKFTCIDANNAIICSGSSGPIFGASDIYVSNLCNANNSSFSNFPNSYRDITGKGQSLFAGRQYFTIAEIEVFQVV